MPPFSIAVRSSSAQPIVKSRDGQNPSVEQHTARDELRFDAVLPVITQLAGDPGAIRHADDRHPSEIHSSDHFFGLNTFRQQFRQPAIYQRLTSYRRPLICSLLSRKVFSEAPPSAGLLQRMKVRLFGGADANREARRERATDSPPLIGLAWMSPCRNRPAQSLANILPSNSRTHPSAPCLDYATCKSVRWLTASPSPRLNSKNTLVEMRVIPPSTKNAR
jgi:hypothetical protein